MRRIRDTWSSWKIIAEVSGAARPTCPPGPIGKRVDADVLGHLGQLRVVLRRVVERDAVRGDGDLAGQEGAVVVDVEPALGAGDEGLVESRGVLRAP